MRVELGDRRLDDREGIDSNILHHSSRRDEASSLCHSERSEESQTPGIKILRCAQNDRLVLVAAWPIFGDRAVSV
jgi:hypothetical protein